MRARRLAIVVVALGLAASCTVPNPAVDDGSKLDAAMFRCRVEPVLAERCAFQACHGTHERTFRVFAPNRLRHGVTESEVDSPLTPEEETLNLRAAVGFATAPSGYAEPLLVAKPLAERLGGGYHEGAEMYGGLNVFEDPDDPGLTVLRIWLDGAAEEPSCAP